MVSKACYFLSCAARNNIRYLPHLLLMVLFALLASNAFAAGVPFLNGLESKIKEITDELKGPIATAIITLIIVIFGLGALSGRINKVFGLGICAGALIITFAGDIATWVTG